MKEYKHEYNGWKNYQTWNVSLWLNNDEFYYRLMQDYVKQVAKANGKADYKTFITCAALLLGPITADGIRWVSTRLSYKQLNAMLQEQVDYIRAHN